MSRLERDGELCVVVHLSSMESVITQNRFRIYSLDLTLLGEVPARIYIYPLTRRIATFAYKCAMYK